MKKQLLTLALLSIIGFATVTFISSDKYIVHSDGCVKTK